MPSLSTRIIALLALLFSSSEHGFLVQSPAPGIEGLWQGALGSGANQLRLLLRITKAPDGTYSAKLDSLDQGSTIPVDKISLTGDVVRLELPLVGGVFQGTLNKDRSELKGTWTQGGPAQPLSFKRQPLPGAQVTGPAQERQDSPLVAEVPSPPVAFKADGKTHLVYELHITNSGRAECGLVRVQAAGAGGTRTIGTVEGQDLAASTLRPGSPKSVGADALRIAAGTRAVVFMWISLGAGEQVPEELTHRIGFIEGTGHFEIITQPVGVGRDVAAIGPPLSGGEWAAANGPANESGHRRAMLRIDGRDWIAQRFAIDWVRLRDNGETSKGDKKVNKNYLAYGSDVLAVTDAVVATIKDGIPDNVPGENSRAVPMTLETLGGNHIILDLGGGHFAFYAHLQPGSLRVKLGDRVTRGQVLALVGNSGNSTEPHLHFHVSDRNSPLASEGLPYALDAFEVQGTMSKWPPPAGQKAEARTKELPAANAVVRFGVK